MEKFFFLFFFVWKLYLGRELLDHNVILTRWFGLVAKSCPTLETPWTVARKAPLSMGFSRQEYWSRLQFPALGDCPDPGIEP